MTPCAYEPCDKPVNARGLCNAHYQQWRRRGSIHLLTPARHYRGLTTETIETDVEEYHYMTVDCGESIERTLDRLGMSARTMIRRHKRLGKPVPAQLWRADSRKKTAA